jgi:hypothetical protein
MTSNRPCPDQPLARHLGWLASGTGSSTTAVTSDWIGHIHAVCDALTGQVPALGRRSWAQDQIQRLMTTQGFTLRRAAETWLEMFGFEEASELQDRRFTPAPASKDQAQR